MNKNLVDIRRTKSSYLIPEKTPEYKDVGIISVLEKLAFRHPLILKGPKGSGKTLAIQEFAASKVRPSTMCHSCRILCSFLRHF